MLEWFRSYLVIIAKEGADVPRTTTTISAKPRQEFSTEISFVKKKNIFNISLFVVL